MSGELMIGDFGLATKLSDEPLTRGVGTLPFISPEVCRGVPYNHKTDIWAVGIMAIEMLDGQLPFDDNLNRQETVRMIASLKRPPTPHKSMSPTMTDFLKKCLAVDPSDRADAIELLNHPFIMAGVPTQELFVIDDENDEEDDIDDDEEEE